MQENKRRIVLVLILVATITISILATTAYFITQGRVVEERLTVKIGTLALTFEDNTDGFDAVLSLGESRSKEFIVKNTGSQPVTTKMYWKNLTNTYLKESLSYKLEYKTSETGEWQDVTTTTSAKVPRSLKSSTKELATGLIIPAGEVYYYKLTIKLENLENINQEQDMRARMTSQFTIGDENVTISSPVDSTLENLNILSRGEKTSFATVATTNEGVFEMADDYGTSYYYRGAVDNNYVKFGGFYWRIIRVNGDGSIRMIYDGTKAHANGETGDENDRFIATGEVWNANYDDAKYVGWMFGGNDGETSTSVEQAQTNTTDSDIKETVVDPWYDNNIKKNAANGDADLSGYLGDEIFCNDRSIPGTSEWSSDTKLGYAKNATLYGALSRFVNPNKIDSVHSWWLANDKHTAQFTCPQKKDAFTVSDTTKGNGSLTRKIGLITADEIVAAGARYYNGDGVSDNKSYYLYRNKVYWLLSPNCYNDTAYVFIVNAGGYLHSAYVNDSAGAIAPVINISADYAKTIVGLGTMDSPYQIPGVD